MITLIAAVAENGVIGSENDIPWYLPADLKHFAQTTTGHTVLMGRKTFESIVKRLGKPLPNRTNLVVTRQADYAVLGADVFHSVDDALSAAKGDVFVIGGGEIYQQTIEQADRLLITEVAADPGGEVQFPEIDHDQWQETDRESHQKDDANECDYQFVTYERR